MAERYDRKLEDIFAIQDEVTSTGGVFEITCDGLTIWERKADRGFPDIKVLKQRVRDRIDPGRDLGHVDHPALPDTASSEDPT